MWSSVRPSRRSRISKRWYPNRRHSPAECPAETQSDPPSFLGSPHGGLRGECRIPGVLVGEPPPVRLFPDLREDFAVTLTLPGSDPDAGRGGITGLRGRSTWHARTSKHSGRTCGLRGLLPASTGSHFFRDVPTRIGIINNLFHNATWVRSDGSLPEPPS